MTFEIESLKDYIHNKEVFIDLADKIYMLTYFISKDYKNYKTWYYNKQLKGLLTEDRNILFTRNPNNKEEIIAMTSLKKSSEEQKLCTIYVKETFRKLGLGTKLLEESMKILETTKPLITFASEKYEMFKPFIDKYNWNLTETVNNLYNNSSLELCFNGSITREKNKKKK